MPDRPALAAERRTVTGKAVARLRNEGLLPGVVYGHGTDTEPVTVDAHEFELLRRHVGASTLVDLEVDGGKARPVLGRSVQVHPVNRRPIHVDLFAVRMTEELTVEVQLVGHGHRARHRARRHARAPGLERPCPRPAGQPAGDPAYDLSPLVDYDTTITVADLDRRPRA